MRKSMLSKRRVDAVGQPCDQPIGSGADHGLLNGAWIVDSGRITNPHRFTYEEPGLYEVLECTGSTLTPGFGIDIDAVNKEVV